MPSNQQIDNSQAQIDVLNKTTNISNSSKILVTAGNSSIDMKCTFLSILILLILTTSCKKENHINEKELGIIIDQYSTIAGAWFLNERCGILSENLKKDFESNVANITVKLNQVLEVNREMLFALQKSGKNMAYDKDRACDNKSDEIVVVSFQAAKDLSEKLNKLN